MFGYLWDLFYVWIFRMNVRLDDIIRFQPEILERKPDEGSKTTDHVK